MIAGIIKAISQALYAGFGEGYNVYTETVRQGLREPCFFVGSLNPKRLHQRGQRYLYRCRFHVQFFPVYDLTAISECHDIAQRLLDILEWLPVYGNLLRGTSMEYEIVDDLLHFFVNYDFYAIKADNVLPSMAELTAITKVEERND